MTTPENTYFNEQERYDAIRQEHHLALQVIAVLAELVLAAYPESFEDGVISIADEALARAPELTAWREAHTYCTMIAVKR
jgi:hypothetical protein